MENLSIGELCVIKCNNINNIVAFTVKKNKLGKWIRKSIRFYKPLMFGLIIDFCYKQSFVSDDNSNDEVEVSVFTDPTIKKEKKYYILLIDDELVEFNEKNCFTYKV